MTLEQAIKRIEDKTSQIRQLEVEVAETKSELKYLTPHKFGDKVLVETTRGEKIVLFISDVEYKSWIVNKYEYKFSKPKKDGTMGNQSSGIYGYKSITAI